MFPIFVENLFGNAKSSPFGAPTNSPFGAASTPTSTSSFGAAPAFGAPAFGAKPGIEFFITT